jgi:hypothetical protein
VHELKNPILLRLQRFGAVSILSFHSRLFHVEQKWGMLATLEPGRLDLFRFFRNESGRALSRTTKMFHVEHCRPSEERISLNAGRFADQQATIP